MLGTPGLRAAWGAALITIGVLACSSTAGPTLTSPAEAPALSPTPKSVEALPPAAGPTPAEPTAAAADPGQQTPVFQVAVIVDMQSEAVSREQAQGAIDEASRLLQPFAPIPLTMTDFVEDSSGGSTNDMASRYMAAHTAALPNGLVIFSFGDGGQAKSAGGYSYSLAAPADYRNVFVSATGGGGQMYVAVVDFNHKYAACGYGGAETVQSTTSLDGECRNQPGTACIQHNGYSMCADSLAHLYASAPNYFVASTIVHELMHPFSTGGDQDHYGTPECNTRMGFPAQFFDLQEGQYYNELCPSVYEEFKKSYQP